MHNELMSASHISRKFNNSSQLDQVKESVVSLLRLMKDVPDFASFFIQDLFSRAESTLKKLSQNEFDGIMEITVSSYREKMEGVVSLDPYNLLFFRQLAIQQGYISEAELPSTLKGFFDLVLAYSMIFNKGDKDL